MKEKQKQQFEDYNNFCKQNGLSACRVESTIAYFSYKQSDVSL